MMILILNTDVNKDATGFPSPPVARVISAAQRDYLPFV